jgi:hypothetical protein
MFHCVLSHHTNHNTRECTHRSGAFVADAPSDLSPLGWDTCHCLLNQSRTTSS